VIIGKLLYSRLSVFLAIKHFKAVAALPGAIFSIRHNLSGAFLAGNWSKTSVLGADKSEMPRISGHIH